jgi:hypothetical protein
MSKRSSTNDTPTNAPVAKKSRIDMDDTVAKAETIITQLLDALKAQKASVQWGHTTCRDDTVASIAKAELIKFSKMTKEYVIVLDKPMRQVTDFKCRISISVDKLVDALVESEIDALVKASKKYTMADEWSNMPGAMILEGLQEYSWEITYDVKKQLKEKFKGLNVEEVIKKVKVEAQSSYKAVAKKYCAEALDRVLS